MRRVPKHFSRVIEKLPHNCSVVSLPPPLQHQIYTSQKKRKGKQKRTFRYRIPSSRDPSKSSNSILEREMSLYSLYRKLYVASLYTKLLEIKQRQVKKDFFTQGIKNLHEFGLTHGLNFIHDDCTHCGRPGRFEIGTRMATIRGNENGSRSAEISRRGLALPSLPRRG